VRGSRGFTLLEVLLATAIMSIGIVSALELFSGSMHLAGASAQQTQALVLGRAVMDAALWRAELPEDVEAGEVGGYGWVRSTRYIDRQLLTLDEQDQGTFGVETDVEYELMEIVVEVNWESPRGQKQIRLESAKLVEAGDLE
jgi:prepilin-type N-terminal cleavage/methylation domain-containing protein